MHLHISLLCKPGKIWISHSSIRLPLQTALGLFCFGGLCILQWTKLEKRARSVNKSFPQKKAFWSFDSSQTSVCPVSHPDFVSYTKIPCNLRSTPSSGTQHWQNQSVSSSAKRNVRSWWHLKESSRGHTAVYPLLSIVNTLHPRSARYFLIADILKADQRYYSHAVKHFVELPSAFLWSLLFRADSQRRNI